MSGSTASPSPPASDATAPLLVSEDLHSLSSSSSDAEGGHTSDWSSPSPSENASDNEEEEEFDLLASQELRGSPSDNSSNSASPSDSSNIKNEGSRMALSFPDPLESAEPVESGPLSPASIPSSNGKKVRADLENSILVDGGAYSLLLDAPNTQSPPLELKEEETTSTPPPQTQAQPSPRIPFSRSSTIIRAKPTSTSTKDAEDKVGKWRSTLTTTTTTTSSPSSLQTPIVSSPASSAILLSLPPSIESSQISGEGGGFSSVTSSQTVIQSTKPTSRATTPPLLDLEKKKSEVMQEKENRIPEKLDELIEKSSRGAKGVGLKRLMSVLTVMGIILAGIASFKLGDLRGTSSIPSVVSKETSLSTSSSSSVTPIAISTSSCSSVLQHTLPTAQPPLSLLCTQSHPPRLPPASTQTPLYTLDAPTQNPQDPAPPSDLKERMLSHAARCVDLERRVESRLGLEGRKSNRRKERRRLKTRRRTLLEETRDGEGERKRQMVFVRVEREVGWKEGFGNAWRYFKEDLEGLGERIKGRNVGKARGGWTKLWAMVKEEEKRMRGPTTKKFGIFVVEGLQGLPRPRLERYPVVRDYVRSGSRMIKQGIKGPSQQMGRYFKGVGKNVGSLPREQALKIKSQVQDLAGVAKRQGGDLSRDAEKHVRRAAKTLRFLRKKGGWKLWREKRRERQKREKREKRERREREKKRR